MSDSSSDEDWFTDEDFYPVPRGSRLETRAIRILRRPNGPFMNSNQNVSLGPLGGGRHPWPAGRAWERGLEARRGGQGKAPASSEPALDR
eukprot:scaffold259046_cov33-Tisochrysis_lutea.AAC.2